MLVFEILLFIIMVVVFVYALKRIKKEKEMVRKLNNGFRDYYEVVSRWMILKNCGRKAEEFFYHYNYNRIVIYGAGPLGEMLCQELKESSINVVCAVDKEKKSFDFVSDIKIISVEYIEEQGDIDAVIITPLMYKGEIMDILCNKNFPQKTQFIMIDEFVNYYYHHEENDR